MKNVKTMTLKMMAGAALLALSSQAAMAVEVGGVKLDDSVTVGGKSLTLNGAGLRVKAVFKVYAMALYLPKKETTTEAVLASEGPRRITLSLMRNISGDDFGQSFMDGMNKNTPKDERKKYVAQIIKMGETFAQHGDMKKGDLIQIDWVPGTGMVSTVNGKPVGEPIAEKAFYNAVMRIWLGDEPADAQLKPLLLGSAG